MDTKERKKSALEEVKRTIERRNANILKGQVGDGAISNPVYRINIMEEVRALSSIKKMDSSTISKVKQSGTVNIRSGINSAKSSLNRSTSRCREAKTPIFKSVVFTVKGNNISANINIVKRLMVGSRSQSSKIPVFVGGWIDCGNPIGSKRKYFKSLHFLKNSWVVVEGRRYYLGSDEYMVTGLKKIDGHYYYFESNIKNGKETAGYMVTYWHDIKGKRYYFGRNGVMVTSKVIDWNGKKYYVEKNGVMAVNKTIVDPVSGKAYKADEKGVLTEGTCNGREYTFPDNINGKLNGVVKKLSPNIKWFSYQSSITGTATDANGRYKIVVGPKILDPNYPDKGKLWTDDFGVKSLNVRIDVVLENKASGNTKTIECVAVGLKAHTYNVHPDKTTGHKHKIFNYNKKITASFPVENGLLQTGIAYPNCWNAQQDNKNDGPIAVDHMNGSPVEFYGSSIDFNANKYKLIKIIVLE